MKVTDLRALLRRGKIAGVARSGLTLEAAGTLCGVTSRTIMNWRDGKSRIPAEALSILEAAAADMEIETAEPMLLTERIAFHRALQQTQHRAVCALEDELLAAKQALAVTNRTLNALLAERGALENR